MEEKPGGEEPVPLAREQYPPLARRVAQDAENLLIPGQRGAASRKARAAGAQETGISPIVLGNAETGEDVRALWPEGSATCAARPRP